jgi:hypothetical protein
VRWYRATQKWPRYGNWKNEHVEIVITNSQSRLYNFTKTSEKEMADLVAAIRSLPSDKGEVKNAFQTWNH